MKYIDVVSATFLSRPNRFIAHVLFENNVVICHVKNTGRCKELLIEGVTVYLQPAQTPNRKTPYDLIAVEKQLEDGTTLLVNLDSHAPNHVFKEWATTGHFVEGLTLLKPESKFGNSRLDFYWENDKGETGFVEVKGVTLEQDGHACFPDAPTQRGVKHLEELLSCVEHGHRGTACFVVQMEGVTDFSPNDTTHPQFGETLRRVSAKGVEVLVLGCHVTPDTLSISHPIFANLS